MLRGMNTRTNKQSGYSNLCGLAIVKLFIGYTQNMVTAYVRLLFDVA